MFRIRSHVYGVLGGNLRILLSPHILSEFLSFSPYKLPLEIACKVFFAYVFLTSGLGL